jgi:chromosome segregation ATPase
MTTAEISNAITFRRERIDELNDQAELARKSLETQKTIIAKAVARRRSDEAEAARKSAHLAAEELEETEGAIEFLTRERGDFEREFKQAEKREAAERASQSATEAVAAIGAFRARLSDVAREIRDLKSATDRAMYEANRDDSLVKSLNGEPMGIFERFIWENQPGIQDLVRELVKLA